MAVHRDPALATLWLPFTEQHLPWPEGQVLFLNARAPLPEFARSVHCQQDFKPDADALERSGVTLAKTSDVVPTSHYALTLLLPPRQRDMARAAIAQAVQGTQVGGHVVLSASNNEGARSMEDDLQKLCGEVRTLSKHKCRVCWVKIDQANINHALLNTWLTGDAVRPLSDARFVSRPGVFAWDRIDPASQLLIKHLPETLSGHAADLGSGFGYLSVELLQRCKGITQVDLYEADARAVALARQNLQHQAQASVHWHDVTQGLPHTYDVIISNPPFHTRHREDRPDIGQQFIRLGVTALNPGGQMWLVANRHLPYEQVLQAASITSRVVTTSQGFKIIHASKAHAAPTSTTHKRGRR